MGKLKYEEEFEINASPKILYPYIFTSSGLQDWFCPKVTEEENNIFAFDWDGEVAYARQTQSRLNKNVRYTFLDDDKGEMMDPNYLDFTIETSELTQGQFLRVTDYSEEEDEAELRDMWHSMIQELRTIIGGVV